MLLRKKGQVFKGILIAFKPKPYRWCGVRIAYIGIPIPIVTVIGEQRTSVVGEKGESHD